MRRRDESIQSFQRHQISERARVASEAAEAALRLRTWAEENGAMAEAEAGLQKDFDRLTHRKFAEKQRKLGDFEQVMRVSPSPL